MAAEDYLDLPWSMEEMDDAPSYYPGERFHTCKRCGMRYLHWVQTAHGWRLFEDDSMHTCSPRSQVSVFPKSALSTLTTTTTTQQYIPLSKEPIMDKNAVAFIRNDVRTLSCVFIPSERNSIPLQDLSRKTILHRTRDLQTYTYLTIDPDVQAGDFCVVMAQGQPKVVYVKDAKDELTIGINSGFEYVFIVSKIDFGPYTRLIEQNKLISDTIRTSYKATMREGFRQALLAGLPADKRDSLSILLNKGESND